MENHLNCYPCLLRQAVQAAQIAGLKPERQRALINSVLIEMLPTATVPKAMELENRVHRLVRQQTGGDPYRQIRKESTAQALALYPRLKAMVADAPDPLETAVRLSIAGNIIDMAASQTYDLEETIGRVLLQPFAIDHLAALRTHLERVGEVLYLGDNAGETVFDRVLMETLGCPVTYVVKGGPMLNDVTWPDALAAGLDQVAQLVDNGSQDLGTDLSTCSPEFRRRFTTAELVIVKGQANYVTLSAQRDRPAPLFFLLQAKCSVVAEDLAVPVGSIVVQSL